LNLKFWQSGAREADELNQRLTRELDAIHAQAANEINLSDLESWGDFLNLQTSDSGERVNMHTATTHSAVYGCVRILAAVVAMLPLPVYERRPNGDRVQSREHNLWSILNFQSAPGETPVEMWEQVLANKFLTGNGYLQAVRNRNGDVEALRPRMASKVTPYRVDEDNKIYRYTNWRGEKSTIHQDDMLHFPCMGYDGLKGMDPITHAGRNAIGTALAQDKFAGRYFANSGMPQFQISYPDEKKLTPDQAKIIQQYVRDRTTGANQHLPLVLAEGGKAESLSISYEATQVLESRAFSVGDIARLFGVPLWLLQMTEKNTSWGSGIEQMSIGAIVYTFAPLLAKLEKHINLKLLAGDGQRFFVEFGVDSLQRGDFKTRIDALTKSLGGNQIPGFMSINEVRAKQNLPALDGDQYDKPYTPPADLEPVTEPGEPTE